MNIRKNKKGFTLMELVVTTAIMGTLAAVAVPSFLETNAKAKMNKTMANISDIGSALGGRFNELAGEWGKVEVFPDDAEGVTPIDLDGTVNALGYGTQSGALSKETVASIIPQVPKSPFGDLDYKVILTNHGAVSYETNEEGNVSVVVTKAKFTIYDQEDSTSLRITFEF